MDTDSDDFQPDPVPRVSKLSKRKKKVETKAFCSTQNEKGDSPLGASRSGRAARKDAEEERFQRELEEAMRLSAASSEDGCSLSSSDIVIAKVPSAAESSQDSAKEVIHVDSRQEPVKEIIKETELLPFKAVKEVKRLQELETQPPPIKPHPDPSKELPEPILVQPSPPKENKRRSRAKKRVIESSDEEDFEKEVDDWEEKVKPRAKPKTPKKTPAKAGKEKKQKTGGKKEEFITAEAAPLSDLNNKRPSPGKPSNMFQAKSPVRPRLTPRKAEASPAPTKSLAAGNAASKPATPGLSSSLASILGKVTSPASPAPSTPLQKKLPMWTPPSKAGTPGNNSSLTSASPRIGMRLGLSRNYKSKPLHPSVKS